MSLWGKLAGAAAGLAVGGPIGALLGGLAGHFAVDKTIDGASSNHKDVVFTAGVIALGAKMAKADGVVTRDEITAFREVFKVPPGEGGNVARIFNLAKQDVAGFEAYADQLADLFSDDPELLRNVVEGLFHIASADSVMHPAEEDFLAEVAGRFGISEDEFRTIRARFVKDEGRDPYDVLGLPREISDADLKAAYRKLVIENHPDRAIAKGLPPEFVAIATEKLAAINDAYDDIRKMRGI